VALEFLTGVLAAFAFSASARSLGRSAATLRALIAAALSDNRRRRRLRAQGVAPDAKINTLAPCPPPRAPTVKRRPPQGRRAPTPILSLISLLDYKSQTENKSKISHISDWVQLASFLAGKSGSHQGIFLSGNNQRVRSLKST
jgi:hypothetical protein